MRCSIVALPFNFTVPAMPRLWPVTNCAHAVTLPMVMSGRATQMRIENRGQNFRVLNVRIRAPVEHKEAQCFGCILLLPDAKNKKAGNAFLCVPGLPMGCLRSYASRPAGRRARGARRFR